jgi:hypothetical protein
MGESHQYCMTEEYLDWLMTLNGDQLIHIVARLTDRTISLLSELHPGGEIPKVILELLHIEETGNKTHILGSIKDMGNGVKEGICSDNCWCKGAIDIV